MRGLVAIVLSGGLAVATSGARAEAPAEGVATVLTNQFGALTRASPRGRLEPVRLYFRGDASRAEFKDGNGMTVAFVTPGEAAAGWLTDGAASIPLPGAGHPMVLDPDQPCSGKGLFADCHKKGEVAYAGRRAYHWRYRLSNNNGPGRTRSGEMWLDAETGLVLGYKGRAGLGPLKEWRVEQVVYGPVPDALFELPAPGDGGLQPYTPD